MHFILFEEKSYGAQLNITSSYPNITVYGTTKLNLYRIHFFVVVYFDWTETFDVDALG